MGNKVVHFDASAKTLLVDDTDFKLTPGLLVLITNKHPRPDQWKTNDYKVYKSLVAQMVIPGERIEEEEEEEESENTDDTDSVESYHDIASTGYSDLSTVDYNSLPGILTSDSDLLSPDPSIPSPVQSRSCGKSKKTKDREPFYKVYGVVYLPGDINGVTKKLHLLAAEFFAPQSGTNWFM